MKRGTMARVMFRKGTASAWARHLVALTLICLLTASPIRAESSQSNLLRLAEILGAVHHLREVCGANESALWRNKMIDLLEIMNISGDRREAMISRFNSGFYGAGRNYPVCTGKAARQTNLLLNEGRAVSARLAADPALFPGLSPASEAAN